MLYVEHKDKLLDFNGTCMYFHGISFHKRWNLKTMAFYSKVTCARKNYHLITILTTHVWMHSFKTLNYGLNP